VGDDPIEEEVSSSSKAPNKKGRTKKTFQLAWLGLSDFKRWLQQVPGNKYQTKCKCCGVILNADKSDLIKHAKRPKHQTNVKSIKSMAPAYKALEKCCSERLRHERNVKEMEAQLSTFFYRAQYSLFSCRPPCEVAEKTRQR